MSEGEGHKGQGSMRRTLTGVAVASPSRLGPVRIVATDELSNEIPCEIPSEIPSEVVATTQMVVPRMPADAPHPVPASQPEPASQPAVAPQPRQASQPAVAPQPRQASQPELPPQQTQQPPAAQRAQPAGRLEVKEQGPVPNPAVIDVSPNSAVGPRILSGPGESGAVPNPANALAHAPTEESRTARLQSQPNPAPQHVRPMTTPAAQPGHAPANRAPGPAPANRVHQRPSTRADGTVGDGPIRVVCRRCRRPVWGWKLPFGVSCPTGPHHAHFSWLMIGIVSMFYAGVTAMAISLFVLIS